MAQSTIMSQPDDRCLNSRHPWLTLSIEGTPTPKFGWPMVEGFETTELLIDKRARLGQLFSHMTDRLSTGLLVRGRCKPPSRAAIIGSRMGVSFQAQRALDAGRSGPSTFHVEKTPGGAPNASDAASRRSRAGAN